MLKKGFFIAALMLLSGCETARNTDKAHVKQDSPYRLYFGGDIVTMTDEQPSYVEAVVEHKGKIVFVGNKDSALRQYPETMTQMDLQGSTMLPGFIDPHSHFMSALMMVNQINVSAPPVGTATNIAQIIAKLANYQQEKNIAEGGWLVGWGYDQELIDEKRHIIKTELDAAFPKHKVILIHVSMHGAVLNSNALAWANIDKNTKTPKGGVIARMPNSNEPAGLIMEMAYIPVFEQLPQPNEAEMLDLMAEAQEHYTSQGYTHAVEGFTHTKHIDFLLKAAEQNKLIIDIASLAAFTEMDKWFDNAKYKFGEYHNKFKLHACKITLDGSPQGKTAFVSKPYLTTGPAGQEHWHGESSITQIQLDALTKKMFAANIPLQIHTNGDAAIDMMIKTVEQAGITAKDDRRTVIVHSQFQRPEHLAKYAELGLTPSYFSMHTYFWGDVHVKNIGKKQADFISPMKAAKEAGLITSNHSDFNVTPLDPFFIMWSAMARESRSGAIIGAEQRIDAYSALQALTTGPAYQFFEENRKGMIKEGLLADFVIVENNPLKQDVTMIKNNKVLATIKEGQTVFSSLQLVGADSDLHGCKSSAGYAWCTNTNQCERPWLLAKEQSFANEPAAFTEFCKN